ncbi:MAG: TldD/PmbA family protein [Aquificaceae bacterium]|nr:TldD/PmbA family protein [Aquificaceae bacterium]MDW8434134.1 TldD/PmbA family protein [Aquificaceae bacterium]
MEKLKSWVEEVLGGDYEYEVYFERKRKKLIEGSQESVEKLSTSEDAGVGIRVFRNGRMGFSFTTSLEASSVKDCVKMAKEACHITPPDEGFTLGNCKNLGELETYYDSDGLESSLEDKIEMVINMERYAKSLDGRVKGVRNVSLNETDMEVFCFSSCGLFYNYRSTWYTSSMSVLVEEGGDQSISYSYVGARRLRDVPFQDMVQEVVFKATATLKPSSFETRRMPVVLYREACASLLEAFSPIFLGDSLVKGKTFLSGMEGQQVFSEKLTIVDDGVKEKGFLSLPVDAEGHFMRRNVLVEKGRFLTFLHSTYTAIKSNAEPTGNSIRGGFKSLPVSDITNLYIEPGDRSLEDLLEQDEVFLVTDLMGLHTVDTVSGDFSLGASGIIYRKGKKEQSVRGVVIGGNIKELLSLVVDVGNDLRFYGNVGAPSLFIENLTVGG